MDAASWPQGLEEEMSSNTCTRPLIERKTRPQEQLNCPRCNSTNTKFCYYNNYSLTQPRYFCKTCRRYWTEGGSLRNVPVGGGSRKNKKSSIFSSSSTSNSSSSTSSDNIKLPDINPQSFSQFPKNNERKELNLIFPVIQENHHHHHHHHDHHQHQNMSRFLEMAKNGSSNNNLQLWTEIASRGLNSFIPPLMAADSNAIYTSGLSIQEFKSSLSFSVQENGGRILFPFAELKQLSTSATEVVDHQNKEQGSTNCNNSNGYWNEMFGGSGGSW